MCRKMYETFNCTFDSTPFQSQISPKPTAAIAILPSREGRALIAGRTGEVAERLRADRRGLLEILSAIDEKITKKWEEIDP